MTAKPIDAEVEVRQVYPDAYIADCSLHPLLRKEPDYLNVDIFYIYTHQPVISLQSRLIGFGMSEQEAWGNALQTIKGKKEGGMSRKPKNKQQPTNAFDRFVTDLDNGTLGFIHVQNAIRDHIRRNKNIPIETKDILCGSKQGGGLIYRTFQLLRETIGGMELAVRRGKDK